MCGLGRNIRRPHCLGARRREAIDGRLAEERIDARLGIEGKQFTRCFDTLGGHAAATLACPACGRIPADARAIVRRDQIVENQHSEPGTEVRGP